MATARDFPAFPEWLTRLRALPAAECGIRWLSDDASATLREEFDEEADEHLGIYGEIHGYTDANLRGDAAGRLAGCVKVGEGAEGGPFVAPARSFGTIINYPAEFWFDPAAPDALFCSLAANCPPHLWVPVGRTAGDVAAALAVYYSGRPADPSENAAAYAHRIRQRSRGRDVPDGWVTSRVLLGMTGDIAGEENRFIRRAAFCRSFDAIASFAGDARLVRETVFHTLQSFSRVRLEHHTWLQYDDGAGGTASPIAAEITYPACPHGDLVRAYNGAMDTDVPEDVPVDVLAALFGFPMKGLGRIYRALAELTDPSDVTYHLGLVTAVEGHDPTLMSCLREFAAHPAARVRDRVGRYAAVTGHTDFVREMLAVEPDDAVRQTLQSLLPRDV